MGSKYQTRKEFNLQDIKNDKIPLYISYKDPHLKGLYENMPKNSIKTLSPTYNIHDIKKGQRITKNFHIQENDNENVIKLPSKGQEALHFHHSNYTSTPLVQNLIQDIRQIQKKQNERSPLYEKGLRIKNIQQNQLYNHQLQQSKYEKMVLQNQQEQNKQIYLYMIDQSKSKLIEKRDRTKSTLPSLSVSKAEQNQPQNKLKSQQNQLNSQQQKSTNKDIQQDKKRSKSTVNDPMHHSPYKRQIDIINSQNEILRKSKLKENGIDTKNSVSPQNSKQTKIQYQNQGGEQDFKYQNQQKNGVQNSNILQKKKKHRKILKKKKMQNSNISPINSENVQENQSPQLPGFNSQLIQNKEDFYQNNKIYSSYQSKKEPIIQENNSITPVSKKEFSTFLQFHVQKIKQNNLNTEEKEKI